MNEYDCFPMHISYDCCWWLLERTLSYCCEQSIAKFNIKTGVVIYELVKQLSLIIVAELRYWTQGEHLNKVTQAADSLYVNLDEII